VKALVYDIETLANAFVCCLYNIDQDKRKHFVVYEKQDCTEFVQWLNKYASGYHFVGFNNLAFDAQVIAAIVKNPKMNAYDIYAKAQSLIESKDELGDKTKSNTVPEWKLPFKQIDIYKIKHYDSDAKRTSLKWLEFSFKQQNVMEMPIHHTEHVTVEQLDTIIEYCWNDVETTYKAYEYFKDDINCRMQLSQEFGIDLTNASEPRTVKRVYVSELSKALNISKEEMEERCEEYKRNIKPFKPTILPLNYQDPVFEGVKKRFSDTVIDPDNIKGSINFSYKWKNVKMHHGLGGLHACTKQGVYTNDRLTILDIDFTSYYPFLKIRNGIYPPYYGPEYLEIYEGFFHKRQNYPKGHPLNNGFKLMLNGSFGLLIEKNSPIYYPQGAMFVTVNGQLILLYMLEQINRVVSELVVLQCNTDGITIMFPSEKLTVVMEQLKAIEELTRIGIETVEYSKMIIRDVNNYIAVTTKGKAKHKGAFEIKKEMHKNNSFAIIPKALDAYFVEGVKDFRGFIREHTDIFDFLGAVKKRSNFNLDFYSIGDDGELSTEEQQRITRYFVSNKGGTLVKDFSAKGQRQGKVRLESGWTISIANNLTSFNATDYDIDYTYYFKETEKIIESIEGSSNQMLLFQ